ncbi:UDP-glucuronic acid decarboxylase family protein [Croceicoccus mobilis]|uniref:NAD-dependent dehydratase n=1 Tax=Croceicoccus mobilis TaxID=1703339 RepID=A0A916YXL4_9SPHN|nr:UDP-glucuronic acid decarboxylase family protein [Croceicoccus mobilis]GGD65808.1 NAD-dependent dehydratase [Croceicoccus mobilis]
MSEVIRRAVVAGGAGFLGSHLCDQLIELDYHVTCVDNFTSGRVANISHLLGDKRFDLIQADICSPLPSMEVDEVWNLACPASPPRYQIDPVQTMMTSVLGTKNLLDLARANKARFFQASTSEVYGDPEQHPQPEHYTGSVNTIGPRACYDEGKRAAESLCFDYLRTYNVDIRVVRIFNTYGPRMDPEDGRVVSNFIVKALKGEPLELYGSGDQTRSFCYVDDLIAGFLRLMHSDGCHGPVNIGNPGEFTVKQLAEIVVDKLGSKSEIVCVPATMDDPKQRKPDITLARDRLQWEPLIPLSEGLDMTANYFAEEVARMAPAAISASMTAGR